MSQAAGLRMFDVMFFSSPASDQLFSPRGKNTHAALWASWGISGLQPTSIVLQAIRHQQKKRRENEPRVKRRPQCGLCAVSVCVCGNTAAFKLSLSKTVRESQEACKANRRHTILLTVGGL